MCVCDCMNGSLLAHKLRKLHRRRRRCCRCRSVEQSALASYTRVKKIIFTSFSLFFSLSLCTLFAPFRTVVMCILCVSFLFFIPFCAYDFFSILSQLTTQLLYSDVQWRHIFSIWFPVVHISFYFSVLFSFAASIALLSVWLSPLPLLRFIYCFELH